MATIGENIKKIRLSQNKTQAEFAKQAGLSRSYLGDLENNRKSPSAETMKKLANNIGVSMRYLFEGEDYQNFELTAITSFFDELRLELEYNEKYLLKCDFKFEKLRDQIAEALFPDEISTKIAMNYYFSFYLKEGRTYNPYKNFLPDLEAGFESDVYSGFFSYYQSTLFRFISKYLEKNDRILLLKDGSKIKLDESVGFAIYREGTSLDFVTVL